MLEVYVADHQAIEPRTVQNSSKRARKDRTVIDFLAFDGTGPVKVSLWDTAAVGLKHQLVEFWT